ncbi:MAG: DUF616 domain-containing protein [Dongiaceae bacterium]
MSNELTDLLPLRIEAAVQLDQTLRLKGLLEAERASPVARILETIGNYFSALHGRTKRAKRSRIRKPNAEAERCAAVLLKSELFDSEYYLRRNPDVAEAGVDPVLHYVLYGASEMRDPGPWFSTRWYVWRYPDVRESGLNPLYHFIMRGYSEGRLAGPRNAAERAAMNREMNLGINSPTVVHMAAAQGDSGLEQSPMQPASQRCSPGRRLVVYTALFEDYDDLFTPSQEQAELCDFVVFTDRPDVPAPWQRGTICYATPNHFKRNRFYKLLPHRLFPNYEWSLYLDGNVDIRMNPVEFLERYCRLGSDFFVFRHPRRTSILEELAACIEMKKDDAELMVRQVAQYFEHGFRHTFVLTENNVLLRRHNDPALAALSEAWWEEVRSKSQRDQLSLSYVVEKQRYERIALFDEGHMVARRYPGLRLREHRARSSYVRGPLDDAFV